LDLTAPASGLELGAITPHDPAASTLVERVTSTDDSLRMPPTGPPLTADQQRIFKTWIEQGASWPAHWAYQPLQSPAIPATSSATSWKDWGENPVDQFIAARLRAAGLGPNPPADRFTLLRRASFDLRGIPPSSSEIEQFLRDDSAAAWPAAVERLLASPAYGERWTRRWIDLVHFAETHGHDQDRPREHAWPYRDYLITSFNQDKPYGQFVAEQIAGDALAPTNPQAIVATGFLAAGPWDESSLRDIQENSLDREVGRYLDRDDIVTTVMSTFASTSIHCARCHDHKFDPISQAEYYGVQAVFAGIDKGNRPYDRDPQVAQRRSELTRQLQALDDANPAALGRLWEDADLQAEFTQWLTALQSQPISWTTLEPAAVTSWAGSSLQVQDDLSVLVSGGRPDKDVYVIEARFPLEQINAVRLELLPDDSLPAAGPGRADNGNLHLTQIRVFHSLTGESARLQERTVTAAWADFNQADWGVERVIDKNPNTAWGIFPEVGKEHHAVFTLDKGLDTPPNPNPSSGSSSKATADDPQLGGEQVEGELTLRVELHQLHGGAHTIGRFRLAASDASAEQLQQHRDLPTKISNLLAIPPESRSRAEQSELLVWYQRQSWQAELDALPQPSLVYAGSNQFQPEGSFRPAASPRNVQILRRGLIGEPLGEATAGALSCVTSMSAELEIADLADESARRRGLAEWLSDKDNPLVWRSMANRVWQVHFQNGLVDTPNDFGLMGAAPTHPELLDWLTVQLRDHGGSIKHLHRLLLTSATYRQSSADRVDGQQRDAANRLLWKMHRRRLDAESFRDALLVLTQSLDRSMGGPSVKQFIQSPGVHVTPVVDYQNFDVDDPKNYRRSVYRFLFRTIPDPFMESLDCPDASQLTPTRNVSLTALQALATLNDKFVVRQSELMAARLTRQSADIDEQVQLAYERIFARPPMAEEHAAVRNYAAEHGLANACRFLFNTNEFMFVD